MKKSIFFVLAVMIASSVFAQTSVCILEAVLFKNLTSLIRDLERCPACLYSLGIGYTKRESM